MSRTVFDRRDLLLIAAGGVAGAFVRWLVTETGATEGGWFAYAPTAQVVEPGVPWRTLAVNVVGAGLLGAVLVLRRRHVGDPRMWTALGTGFCGSLTTFSTLAVELATRAGAPPPRPGFAGATAPNVRIIGTLDVPALAGYLTLSVGLGVVAFVVGRRLAMRRFT